jgi:autotransporter-associated beta strand protein
MHFGYYENSNKCYVDLNGGVLTCSNTLYAAYQGGNDVTVRLNPNGLFRCNAYVATAEGSTTRFYGNGGTFRPLCRKAAAQTMEANIFTHLYASTNGLVVDTSETLDGAPFTMAQAILHDPDCASADGGLVKRGAGLLTLTGANTYTGPTVVEEGVLVVSGTGTLGAGGGLAVARGAICDLGGTAQAVGDVVASGLVRNGALTVGGSFCATDDLLLVNGDFTLASTAAVDFAAVSAADVAAGVPLAAVFGTATLPECVRALNAGTVRSVAFVQADNVVYAVPAPTGTVLIFR